MKKFALKYINFLCSALIYFVIVFSPWAFGTTENWSISVVCIAAYVLGFLLFAKKILSISDFRIYQFFKKINIKSTNSLLSVLISIILLYILISALNARASFDSSSFEYTYFETFKKFLPHSYDANSTWFLFWQYLSLVLLFMSIKHWLYKYNSCNKLFLNTSKVKIILNLICFNGTLLAIVSILQRFFYQDGNGDLLFLIQPSINIESINQFGPFAYRSNAASYLNIIIPIIIGLYIQSFTSNTKLRSYKFGSSLDTLYLPCIIILVGSVVVCASRGGLLVLFISLVFCMFFMFIHFRKSFFLYGIILFVLFSGLGLGAAYGFDQLKPRIQKSFIEGLGDRKEIYKTVIDIRSDYGLYGSGPGTFQTVMFFEIQSPYSENQYSAMSGRRLERALGDINWHSWAHNDFLEFLLTFGVIGSIIIFLILTTLIYSCIINNFPYIRIFKYFILISLFGVVIHSLLDFPFQVYSILVLLTIIMAVSCESCDIKK